MSTVAAAASSGGDDRLWALLFPCSRAACSAKLIRVSMSATTRVERTQSPRWHVWARGACSSLALAAYTT